MKEFFDVCKEEERVDNFIADLLISNSTKELINPILIEFCVTHKNSEEKNTSKYKIIEIFLDSEETLNSIISSDKLYENDITKYINFNREQIGNKKLFIDNVISFKLYKTGKAYCETTTCDNTVYSNKAIYQCFFKDDMYARYNSYRYGFLKAKEEGFINKSCRLCKYNFYNDKYEDFICVLYKKCGTPITPDPIYADKCNFYKFDDEFEYM